MNLSSFVLGPLSALGRLLGVPWLWHLRLLLCAHVLHVCSCVIHRLQASARARPLQVWKKGTRMRVDGSLMGIDDKSAALIPEWKRGHFSLLFDGAAAPATVLLLDHKKQTVVDLQAEKKRHRPDLDTEARISFDIGSRKGVVVDYRVSWMCCAPAAARRGVDTALFFGAASDRSGWTWEVARCLSCK